MHSARDRGGETGWRHEQCTVHLHTSGGGREERGGGRGVHTAWGAGGRGTSGGGEGERGGEGGRGASGGGLEGGGEGGRDRDLGGGGGQGTGESVAVSMLLTVGGHLRQMLPRSSLTTMGIYQLG
jgi:hypothetical protein